MKMEQTECPETSEYKIQTPGNYPEDSMQHVLKGFANELKMPTNFASKYISRSIKFTAIIFIFRRKLWFRDFRRVKNNAWVLIRAVIFSSENRK